MEEKLPYKRSDSAETLLDDHKLRQISSEKSKSSTLLDARKFSYLLNQHKKTFENPPTAKESNVCVCKICNETHKPVIEKKNTIETVRDVPDDRIVIEKLESTPSQTPIYNKTCNSQFFTPRSEYEGQFYDDYMQFLIEPCDEYIPEWTTVASSENISCHWPELQRTIAIVKPEGMVYKDAVLRAIVEAGFQVIGTRFLHLTPEQVSEIYRKYYGSYDFPMMVVTASSKPVLALSLASMNAITKWKQMVGPNGTLRDDWFYPISVRCRFGLKRAIPNAIHASKNLGEATWENQYFFPDSIQEPLLAEEFKVTDYLSHYVNPTLLNGLVAVVKYKPMDPILFLADWLLMNNPFQPRLPTYIAEAPT